MTGTAKRPQRIQVGDTVAFSIAFLKRIGHENDEVSEARGKVTSLIYVQGNITLADIDWDTGCLPKRVEINHLTTVKDTAPGE